jgi:hypothetical protein
MHHSSDAPEACSAAQPACGFPNMSLNCRSAAGLPDGIFSQFLYIFEGLGVENFGKFFVHLVSVIAFWYILVSFFGIFGTLSRFGMLYEVKSGSPAQLPFHCTNCFVLRERDN